MKPRCFWLQQMMLVVWYAGCVAASQINSATKTELSSSAAAGGAKTICLGYEALTDRCIRLRAMGH